MIAALAVTISAAALAGGPAPAVIPEPVSARPDAGAFTLASTSRVVVRPGGPELLRVGRLLAARLRRPTGYELPVVTGVPRAGDLVVRLGARAGLGSEGYELRVTRSRVTISAVRPAGVFYGVQTLRQLLPASIERSSRQPGPWRIRAVTIVDRPRFAWRGMMLDVARHFFGVADVKRLVDLMALYKLNRLHLHLSDDQGWRIAIPTWPRLAEHGGSTEVGGGPGGYYTGAQYRRIVAYARSRHVTVVPEIDMPGHVGAALASYPELACDGRPRALVTDVQAGYSSLCTGREATYRFVEDVVSELARLTPGPYLHVGGDEAGATRPADYRHFEERVLAVVARHGKRAVGWEEVARARLAPGTIVQHWNVGPARDLVPRAFAQGAKVIMSPADKAYMDMKYRPSTRLGLTWAGYTSVRDAYEWDPVGRASGVPARAVLGVEAALWSETLSTWKDVDSMAFPRLLGYAELGWSPRRGRLWGEYRLRLAAQGPRLEALGVRFYRDPAVPWR